MTKKTKIIKYILVVAFLGFGLSKFLMPEMMKEAFRVWGYPDWFRIVVGVGEIGAGLLLLLPKCTKIISGLLALEMVGAMITHIRVGQFEQLPPAIVMFILSSVLFLKLRKGTSSPPQS